jgi:putative oxidoreductase
MGPTWIDRLVHTDAQLASTIGRLGLGLIMFPHAAQKVLGWFGGYGFSATYDSFTMRLGIPGWLAAVAIIMEFLSSIGLVLGVFTRVSALGIIAMMVGAIVTVHAPNGFFMNWTGHKAGEGFEYHLLAITLGLVCLIAGGGRASIDRLLTRGRVHHVDLLAHVERVPVVPTVTEP